MTEGANISDKQFAEDLLEGWEPYPPDDEGNWHNIERAIDKDIPLSPRNTFEIDNLQKLEWLVKTLQGIRSEQAVIKEQAEKRLKTLSKREESLLEWFKPQVARYMDKQREEGVLRGSVLSTLHGDIKQRKFAQTVAIRDKSEALDYAKSSEDARGLVTQKFTETLDAVGFKKYAERVLAETGEIIDGVEIVPARTETYL